LEGLDVGKGDGAGDGGLVGEAVGPVGAAVGHMSQATGHSSATSDPYSWVWSIHQVALRSVTLEEF